MKYVLRLLAVAGVVAFCGSILAADSGAAPWPTFRGPTRTAVAPDTGLLQTWPEGGPKLVWEAVGVGQGYSSVAIAEGRIYTMGDNSSITEDKDTYLFAYNLETGKPQWKTKLGPAWTRNYNGTRSTPTVDGPRVYALTPQGALVCCDSATGTEKWRKDMEKDFAGKKGDGWGYSESVTIDGDKLLCTPGNVKNTMVALNKETGEPIWSASQPVNKGAGHASIVVTEIGNSRVYVQTTAQGAIGVRASDGKLLWNYDFGATAVIPTPIVKGDLVFVTAGYGKGGALLKQVPAADNGVTIEEIYPLKSALNNRHGGVVLVGDYLFGDSDHGGIPFCADLLTGEVKWKERGSGSGSAAMAAADGCLYIHYADGTMTLVEATPQSKNKELGKFKVPHSGGGRSQPSWAHPVIANGKLFIREFDHILCYDIKAQ